MYPNGIFATGYSRHIISMCEGIANVQMILYRRPRNAKYFDLGAKRYASQVGPLDESGYRYVIFVDHNGAETRERVKYPQMISVYELSFAADVKTIRNSSDENERYSINKRRALRI